MNPTAAPAVPAAAAPVGKPYARIYDRYDGFYDAYSTASLRERLKDPEAFRVLFMQGNSCVAEMMVERRFSGRCVAVESFAGHFFKAKSKIRAVPPCVCLSRAECEQFEGLPAVLVGFPCYGFLVVIQPADNLIGWGRKAWFVSEAEADTCMHREHHSYSRYGSVFQVRLDLAAMSAAAALFPTIGPAEERRYIAAGRARAAGRRARLSAALSALSARGLRVGYASQLPAAPCSDRSSPVAGMTSTGAASAL